MQKQKENILIQKGISLVKNNKYDQRIKCFNDAIQINPQNKEVYEWFCKIENALAEKSLEEEWFDENSFEVIADMMVHNEKEEREIRDGISNKRVNFFKRQYQNFTY